MQNCKLIMKPTCFHFLILYLKQRTFSFLEQRRRIKLLSLSLLVDTTRRATLLLRKNRKSSNIDPHSFTSFCACFLPITTPHKFPTESQGMLISLPTPHGVPYVMLMIISDNSLVLENDGFSIKILTEFSFPDEVFSYHINNYL